MDVRPMDLEPASGAPAQSGRTIVLPQTDNEPGAPALLCRANELYRRGPWPYPYDKTTHRISQGDARALTGIADESVELIRAHTRSWLP